jgi:hypothetical protein
MPTEEGYENRKFLNFCPPGFWSPPVHIVQGFEASVSTQRIGPSFRPRMSANWYLASKTAKSVRPNPENV